MRIP
jgi:hypothetical protein